MARAAATFASSNLTLAYGPATSESARIDVALRDLRVEGTDLAADSDLEIDADAPSGRVAIALVGDASADALAAPMVAATLEVTATFDPGDGDVEVSVFGPVACAPLES